MKIILGGGMEGDAAGCGGITSATGPVKAPECRASDGAKLGAGDCRKTRQAGLYRFDRFYRL
ncbi:MAG: hypothetical protein HHJ19_12190 [Polaromonas sp.]|nr:hypothetical protein [Polaromonas sp.]